MRSPGRVLGDEGDGRRPKPDLVGSNTGTYKGAAPTAAMLPNGDAAAHFDGSTGYLTIPSNAVFSLPTTHNLTWEGWINADTLHFPNASSDGYIDWMGKCADYTPTCEWEARMYSTTTSESRPNRMSAYIFNNTGQSRLGRRLAAGRQPHQGGQLVLRRRRVHDAQRTVGLPEHVDVPWVDQRLGQRRQMG